MKSLIAALVLMAGSQATLAADKVVARCGDYELVQTVRTDSGYFMGIPHREERNAYYILNTTDKSSEKFQMTFGMNSSGAVLTGMVDILTNVPGAIAEAKEATLTAMSWPGVEKFHLELVEFHSKAKISTIPCQVVR